jgi:hypothetical protein
MYNYFSGRHGVDNPGIVSSAIQWCKCKITGVFIKYLEAGTMSPWFNMPKQGDTCHPGWFYGCITSPRVTPCASWWFQLSCNLLNHAAFTRNWLHGHEIHCSQCIPVQIACHGLGLDLREFFRLNHNIWHEWMPYLWYTANHSNIHSSHEPLCF